jgi:hypothetical protein
VHTHRKKINLYTCHKHARDGTRTGGVSSSFSSFFCCQMFLSFRGKIRAEGSGRGAATHHEARDGHPATRLPSGNDAADTFATPWHQRRPCVNTPLMRGIEVGTRAIGRPVGHPRIRLTPRHASRRLVRRPADCCAEKGGANRAFMSATRRCLSKTRFLQLL